jgi:hypothetical protein
MIYRGFGSKATYHRLVIFKEAADGAKGLRLPAVGRECRLWNGGKKQKVHSRSELREYFDE